MATPQPIEQLNHLFGNYRAEWLRERIFELFTQPSYFPDLEAPVPCVLLGGRGTGKTTALRSLSYEGRFALSGANANVIQDWTYFGFYYRVDTNRVTAFQGPELEESVWIKLFGHYVNLLFCGQVLKFLDWHSLRVSNSPVLPPHMCKRVAIALRLEDASTVGELIEQLDYGRLRFEAYLNNLSADALPSMSLQGAPIDELISAVSQLPQFKGKRFFFLVDEFENFLDYQQIVMNTLIKHSSESHCFKIGVRELGWRRRATLNPNEQLNSPADYVRISISDRLEDRFDEFASQICNQRLAQIQSDDACRVDEIQHLLPGLTEEDEAVRLGLDRALADSVGKGAKPAQLMEAHAIDPLELYFAAQWAQWQDQSLADVLRDRAAHLDKWQTRYSNYKHALLFTIKRGRTGIRKYYAGWRSFLLLSGGNIRYLLELVDRTLVLHHDRGGKLGEPVSCEIQTIAAQNVGMKNVAELEGLSVHGAQLTKLVLGLGRVFQVLAFSPQGHSPEQNQFHLIEDVETDPEVIELLNAAVMHLALVRSSGTKLLDDTDIKAYDYSLHPIFAPFFVFSYRKKRKFTIAPAKLLGLVKDSKATIKELLRSYEEGQSEPMPEQLRLFEQYYDSAS